MRNADRILEDGLASNWAKAFAYMGRTVHWESIRHMPVAFRYRPMD